MACYPSICLFEQKGIDWLKSYIALKWKEMDLRALQEKDCSSHLYDSDLFKRYR